MPDREFGIFFFVLGLLVLGGFFFFLSVRPMMIKQVGILKVKPNTG